MKNIVINHLVKINEPLGDATRAIAELREMFPKSHHLRTAQTRVCGVSLNLQEFIKQSEQTDEERKS